MFSQTMGWVLKNAMEAREGSSLGAPRIKDCSVD